MKTKKTLIMELNNFRFLEMEELSFDYQNGINPPPLQKFFKSGHSLTKYTYGCLKLTKTRRGDMYGNFPMVIRLKD